MRLMILSVIALSATQLQAQDDKMFRRVDKSSWESWSDIHKRIGELWDPSSEQSKRFARTVKTAQSEGLLKGEAEVKQLASGLLKDYSNEYSTRISKIVDEIAAKTNYRIQFQIPRDNEYARALFIHHFYEQLQSQRNLLMGMPKSQFPRRAMLVAKYSDNKAYAESFKSNFGAIVENNIAPEFVSENSKTDFVIVANGEDEDSTFALNASDGRQLRMARMMERDGALKVPELVRDEAGKLFLVYESTGDIKVKVNGEEQVLAKGDSFKVEVSPLEGIDMMSRYQLLSDFNKSHRHSPGTFYRFREDGDGKVDGIATLNFPITTGFKYERHVSSGDEAETGVYILQNGVIAYPKKVADITKEEARAAKLIMVHDIGSLPAVADQTTPEKKIKEKEQIDLKKFIDKLGFKDGFELIPAQKPCELI